MAKTPRTRALATFGLKLRKCSAGGTGPAFLRLSMQAVESRETRSPLKHQPLRQAGQSVEEMRRDFIESQMEKAAVASTTIALAVMEWLRYAFHMQPSPWVMSAFAAAVTIWALLRLRKASETSRRMRQGRDGERIAGESLEKLRTHGYEVFHDVVAGNFNIDHVVVGPSGIYAIETKTLSKRGGAEEKADTDGEAVFIKGVPLPDNPVPQAKGNARWVADYLQSTTATRFPVTPVILLPGWYVTSRANRSELLLLNEHENMLRAWIVDKAATLSKADQALVTSRLALFLRGRNGSQSQPFISSR